jgi:hypothetical protein
VATLTYTHITTYMPWLKSDTAAQQARITVRIAEAESLGLREGYSDEVSSYTSLSQADFAVIYYAGHLYEDECKAEDAGLGGTGQIVKTIDLNDVEIAYAKIKTSGPAEELLTTTRAGRKYLQLQKPVPTKKTPARRLPKVAGG